MVSIVEVSSISNASQLAAATYQSICNTELMRRVQIKIILIVAATFVLSWWWKREQLVVLLLPIDYDEQVDMSMKQLVDIRRNNNTDTSVVKVYAPSNSSSNVAMCVIIKNETLYIDEWVDFHIALGFSPIYIYDNSLAFDLKYMHLTNSIYSWYDTREDIHKHIKLIHYPVAGVQIKAYDRCIKKDAANSTYVALTDIDEFLVLTLSFRGAPWGSFLPKCT